jgi:hypothetical protein
MKQINFMMYALAMLMCMSLTAHAQYQDFTFLRVDNINQGFSKLKLGNNPDSFWTGADVAAGGNNMLSVTFRIPEGSPDYSRIQIRPNGSSASPVNLAAYLPAGFQTGYDWYTIHIPLSDFQGSINFTNLYLIQIPYSASAGDFVFDLKRLEFTGGSMPYVWYGHENHGNIQDGNGYNGQMVAYEQSDLYMTANLSYSKNNPPYNGTASLIATYKDQYDQEAFAALWTWDDGYVGRHREDLNPRTYQVVFGPLDGAYDTLSFTVETTLPLEVTVAYLSPTDTQNGGFTSFIRHGMPPYQSNYAPDEYVYFAQMDKEKLYEYFSPEGNEWDLRSPLYELRQDYYNNFYQLQRSYSEYKLFLTKRDFDNNVLWSRDQNFVLRDDHIYTDPLGNTLVFQRVKKESIIDGKRYSSPYELHAFICYDTEGNVKWVKYINDLIFSVRTADVVVDDQGKVNWLLRQGDSRGYKTILYSMAMNGNEIERKESVNYSGFAYNSFGFYDNLVTLPSNELFAITYQSAGTGIAGSAPVQYDGFYMTKFSPEGDLVFNYALDNDEGRGEYNVIYEHKLLITDGTGYTRYYDADGNFVWGREDVVMANDNLFYTQDNLYRAWTYDLEFLGAFPAEGALYHIGNFQEVYERINTDFGFNTILTRNFPVASEQSPIPPGADYFEYVVTDSVHNKYVYTAGYQNLRAAADEALNEQLTAKHTIGIYPNPAVNEVILFISEPQGDNRVILTDLNGRIVGSWQNIPATGFSIPRNNLQAGIYLVTYEDAAIKQTKRMVFK